MKKIFLAIVLVAAIISCSHKTPPTKTATSTTIATGDADAGKQIYVAKCGRCHGLKDPANYTSDEWVPLLNKMAVKAKLDSNEKANVWAYVQANAKH